MRTALTATLFLIRHAAHIDLDKRLSGRSQAVPLSRVGEQQADAVAARLRPVGLDRVVSSPLARAMVTAEAIAVGSRLPAPEPVDGLLEIDFGDWTGRGFDSLNDDVAWHAWNSQRHLARPPGGESMAEAQARIVGWMTAQVASGGAVAAVTHADMIRAAVAHVLGLPLDKLLRFDIDPASITTIMIGDWGAKLVRLNEKGA